MAANTAGRELHNRPPDVHQTDRCNLLIVANILRVAISELTVLTVPPTLDTAGLKHRARTKSPGFDLCDAPTDIHVAGQCGDFVIPYGLPVAVAELAPQPEPPAAHRPGVEQSARVTTASRNLHDAPADVHVAGLCGHFVISDGLGIAVAELAVAGIAPAAQCASLQHRARVKVTHCEIDHGDSHIHGLYRGRDLVVADIAWARSVGRVDTIAVPELP